MREAAGRRSATRLSGTRSSQRAVQRRGCCVPTLRTSASARARASCSAISRGHFAPERAPTSSRPLLHSQAQCTLGSALLPAGSRCGSRRTTPASTRRCRRSSTASIRTRPLSLSRTSSSYLANGTTSRPSQRLLGRWVRTSSWTRRSRSARCRSTRPHAAPMPSSVRATSGCAARLARLSDGSDRPCVRSRCSSHTNTRGPHSSLHPIPLRRPVTRLLDALS